MKLVDLESPFAGSDPAAAERNLRYARAAMADALRRGEAPLASHLLYTQPGILDDGVPDERAWGIDAGKAWAKHAEATVVYTDLGISRGMEFGIQVALRAGRPIEYRSLSGWSA